MITAKINPQDLQDISTIMRKRVQLLGDDGNFIFMRTNRTLAKNLIKYTPPLGESQSKARAQGEKAVERDLARAVCPIKTETIKNPKLKKQLEDFRNAGDFSGMREALKRSKWNVEWVVPFSPEYHTSRAYGATRIGIRKASGFFTPEVDQWQKYTDEVKKHVGSWKSVWVPYINAINNTNAPGDKKATVSIPGYVKRNVGRYGSRYGIGYITANKDKSYALVEGSGPNMNQLNRHLSAAIRLTLNGMLREYRHLVKKALKTMK